MVIMSHLRMFAGLRDDDDAGGRRRRRRRHMTKPKDISTGAPADHADNAATSTAALCFPEPDLLALALCASAGPPAWVVSFDPMLEELATSLVVSRPMEHQRLGVCLLRRWALRRLKHHWWKPILRRWLLSG